MIDSNIPESNLSNDKIVLDIPLDQVIKSLLKFDFLNDNDLFSDEIIIYGLNKSDKEHEKYILNSLFKRKIMKTENITKKYNTKKIKLH